MLNLYDKFAKKISGQILRCLSDYNIVMQGPIVIGLSGGKDSSTLLILLNELGFDVRPIVVDLGYSNFNANSIVTSFSKLGINVEVVSAHNEDVLKELNANIRTQLLTNLDYLENLTEETPCSACSQIKRQLLIHSALKFGAKWVALGHHRNDLITTILKDYYVELYYAEYKKYNRSQFQEFVTKQDIDIETLNSMVKKKSAATMSIQVKMTSKVSLIRPMAYVLEDDIIKMIRDIDLAVFGSGCSHGIFSSMDNVILTKREIVHEALKDRFKKSPKLTDQLLEVALRSLDKEGIALFNPRESRHIRYPEF